jgi:surfeit locus 1 family protein
MTSAPRAPAASSVHPARRRPAWIPAVAAWVTMSVCVTAGHWQYRRMQEKEALQAQFQAAAAAAPVALPREVRDWHAWRFRAVVLDGEFDARHQILVDNKVHDGRVGFEVVAPLRLSDGRIVLIDRGWVAAGATRAVFPQPPLPAGVVSLRGRIDLPAPAYWRSGSETLPAGTLWQHLETADFTRATGVAVLPIVVRVLDMPGNAGLVIDDALPDAGIDKHLSYMVQWYAFAAMAAGLWLWFDVRPRLARSAR